MIRLGPLSPRERVVVTRALLVIQRPSQRTLRMATGEQPEGDVLRASRRIDDYLRRVFAVVDEARAGVLPQCYDSTTTPPNQSTP